MAVGSQAWKLQTRKTSTKRGWGTPPRELQRPWSCPSTLHPGLSVSSAILWLGFPAGPLNAGRGPVPTEVSRAGGSPVEPSTSHTMSRAFHLEHQNPADHRGARKSRLQLPSHPVHCSHTCPHRSNPRASSTTQGQQVPLLTQGHWSAGHTQRQYGHTLLRP